MREVRCPGCGRLLAIEHDNGLFESKTGRQVVWTERAILSCAKCGREVQVGPASAPWRLPPVKGRERAKGKFVDKKKKAR